ncbi:mycofactocin-coupled SDR family oxidoreductase [Nocardia bovistercoris]|uniref:Mycofactocin-coupled SDR family oxidoreductase n=1 Tax=Nocardia bovistercoris TaxID=2785916 RepID=A0A931N0S5_9NOCA|nr:mycofactocin-coupled SDR family oxidoreductase [Nocardia bovistercoris]MBH0775279.1 mycofactocin-coupled SDR family oxidoreductase [Nocardia bovistercoris]
MGGRVEGKVAFITGAARGQGRSHAVRLAEEGADIIAVDLCRDIETNTYALSRPEDLDETARLVEKTGRRIVTHQADVRQRAQLEDALKAGVAEFGGLDIVVAQAGIAPMLSPEHVQAWIDVLDVNLIGVLNAVHAALPYLKAGGSVIATGSAAAFLPNDQVAEPGADPGGQGYMVAKTGLAAYMHELARALSPKMIRANVVHPTNVNTAMLQSDAMYRVFRPDLENPTKDDAVVAFPAQQAMPIPWVETVDISNAIVYLASDESRYVTGLQLRVDGGSYLKSYAYHP